MNALTRIVLGITVAVVALVALVFVVKLILGVAVLALVALAAVYAYNFVRAFARRLASADAVAVGSKTMLPR